MSEAYSSFSMPAMRSRPPLTLELNTAQLVFVPTDGFRTCFVTSLFVYSAEANHHISSQEETEVYEEHKDDISILMLKLAMRHLQAPFPEDAFPRTFEGDGYRLQVVIRPWTLGASLEFGWGSVPVKAAAEKWQVQFEVA